VQNANSHGAACAVRTDKLEQLLLTEPKVMLLS